jgi:hypothetical protein
MLGKQIKSGRPGEIRLDDPPASWLNDDHPLRAIRLHPSRQPADRILFRRDGPVLVISGARGELARRVGGSIANLADAPYRTTESSVPTHLHLDPTSDPDQRWYASGSISLTIHLADEG